MGFAVCSEMAMTRKRADDRQDRHAFVFYRLSMVSITRMSGLILMALQLPYTAFAQPIQVSSPI